MARVITKSPFGTSPNYLLSTYNWERLFLQRKKQKALMMSKTMNGIAPDYLQSLFSQHHSVYNLRDSEGKLTLPKPSRVVVRNFNRWKNVFNRRNLLSSERNELSEWPTARSLYALGHLKFYIFSTSYRSLRGKHLWVSKISALKWRNIVTF